MEAEDPEAFEKDDFSQILLAQQELIQSISMKQEVGRISYNTLIFRLWIRPPKSWRSLPRHAVNVAPTRQVFGEGIKKDSLNASKQ